MKCPLMLKNWKSTPDVRSFEPFDCLQTECAWWDEEKNTCSVKVIAKELTRIQLKGGIEHA